MAHNWTTKTIADFPTGKFAVVTGDDSLGDGTLDNPYRSINQASLLSGSEPIIWGTGGSTGSITLSGNTLHGEYLKGKQTILNLDGGNYIQSSASGTICSDLTIKNGSVDFSIVVPNLASIQRVTFIDCTINNSQDISSWFQTFTDCEFINCTISSTYRGRWFYVRCKFFNTTVLNQKSSSTGFGCHKLESCYVDSFSNIQFATEANIEEINFNDIEGQLMFQDGTNPDVYVDLATALVEHPTKVGINNINADPLFADVSKMAFAVSNASPLLGSSKTGANIGNSFRADTYFCDIDPEMTSTGLGGTATVTNLDGTVDKTVNITQSIGTLLTGVIVVNSSVLTELGPINYIGAMVHDSSLGGLANSNVPDAVDYVDGTAGDNPDNIVYEMRWSTGNTPPTLAAHFDNGGYVTAGNFSTFVWNLKPQLDSAFLGNGDPAFTSATAFSLGVKWIQIRITLIRNTWNNV